jgi:non-homologous end joining protein Ku
VVDVAGEKRTRLAIGKAGGEVSLVKVSRTPREAQHETRRAGASFEATRAEPLADPFAEDPADIEPAREPARATSLPRPAVERGVTTEAGEWVVLDDALNAIDDATRLDGMEVFATIGRAAIPATTIRDAYYIAPAAAGAGNFLAYVWEALRSRKAAALVRWTKRTNQALGAVVAAGRGSSAHLLLLELEWPANVRDVPRRCLLTADVSESMARSAGRAIESKRLPAGDALAGVRDERAAQRSELLELARAGRLTAWEAPEVEATPAEVDAFAAELEAVGS